MQIFKHNYNKKKFKKIVCKECGLCTGKPKFCFNKVYKNRPFVFISIILPKLIKIRDAKIHCPKARDLIVEVFCNQFICTYTHEYNKGCYKLGECITLFESQFGVYTCANKPKPKDPTPSFFCNSNNEAWVKELESYA